MTDLLFRPCDREDDDELLRLHNSAFGSQSSRAWWRWRFREVPRSRVDMLGAFRPDGRCVGMYTGVRVPLHVRGHSAIEDWRALRLSDVCVEEGVRGGLRRGRLALELTKRYFATYCEDAANVVYGFPIESLRRVVLRFTRSQVLCDVVYLVHDLHHRPQAPSDVHVRSVERYGPETDALWDTERSRLGAAIVRDAIYLNWRYAEHPVDYELLEARCRSTNRLRGIAVVRQGGVDPSVACLTEWLVPGDDPPAEAALIRHALDYARARQRNGLIAWFSTAGEHFSRFQTAHGFFARSGMHQELVLDPHNSLGRDWLHQHWYQTLGDIDSY